MKYRKIYQSLVNSRKYRGVKRECGFELHHIIPLSTGGLNNKNNLVKFTLKEHLLAHKLLVKFLKGQDKYKMEFALNTMQAKSSYGASWEYVKKKLRYTKFNCKFDQLLPHNSKHIMYPARHIIKCTRNPKVDELLYHLGFKYPKMLSNKSLVEVKTSILLLIYAYKNGYLGVNGMRKIPRSTVSKKLTNALLEKGYVLKSDPDYGSGINYTLTQEGASYLESDMGRWWQSYEKEIFSGLSLTIKSVRFWNEQNPCNLLYAEKRKGVKGSFIIRPLHRWSFSFLDMMGDFEPTTMVGVDKFLSTLIAH